MNKLILARFDKTQGHAKKYVNKHNGTARWFTFEQGLQDDNDFYIIYLTKLHSSTCKLYLPEYVLVIELQIKKERFFFKFQYAPKWEEEKVRLNKVKDLINHYTTNILVDTTGFGADSNEFIAEHPDEHGEPDLTLKSKNTGNVKMLLEVTGTKFMRGTDYWVRPDKLDYAINNPNKNVWIALHYSEPTEKFIFVKPNLNKSYEFETENINNAGERYVKFNDSSSEVFTMHQFINVIQDQDFDS